MADERTVYSDVSRRSELLSCRKLFHPSYGLFSTIFQRFKHYLNLLEFILISKINGNWLGAPAVHLAVHKEVGNGPSQLPSQQLTGQR